MESSDIPVGVATLVAAGETTLVQAPEGNVMYRDNASNNVEEQKPSKNPKDGEKGNHSAEKHDYYHTLVSLVSSLGLFRNK